MAKSRRQEKEWEYLRGTGRPSLLRPETPEVRWAISKLRSYNARGMSLTAMADQIGESPSLLTRFLRVDSPGMRRSKFEKIRVIEFDDSTLRARVSPLGAQRRLRALRADGFPYILLCKRMGHPRNSPRLQRILTGERGPGVPVGFIIASTARDIERMYDELTAVGPEEFGVSPGGITYSKTRSSQLGYAPSSCWDADTIDDPKAIPEWTGSCGTVFGWRIHQSENIPACQPCTDARSTGPVKLSTARLRELRVRRGLSKVRLAEISGIDVHRYRSWESGQTKPRYQEQLDRVLVALDVTFAEVAE